MVIRFLVENSRQRIKLILPGVGICLKYIKYIVKASASLITWVNLNVRQRSTNLHESLAVPGASTVSDCQMKLEEFKSQKRKT